MSFRNRKSARATFRCTALIAVITAVNASVIARSDPPRRARTITTDGSLSVKIIVILLIVKFMFRGHYT
tara:strand:- start:311 stop:517 length:207 start_codon:yes stop_codon:yes gene_type:complete